MTASLLKSPQVTQTLLSILDVLNTVVVWVVSTRPPTSKSSSLFNYPFVTVSKAPITIGIIVTFRFFLFPEQDPGTYPSFHILLVLFCGQSGQQSRRFCKFSFFFLLIIIWSGFTPCKLFTPALAEGFSLTGVRVTSSLQNSSHYSSRL